MKKVVLTIILIILIGVFCFSGYKIVTYFTQNKENSNIQEELSTSVKIFDNTPKFTEKNEEEKKEKVYEIDFKSLKKKNKDTVAFLAVKGTDVEYVVVKAKDNDYYLNHNFNKKYNVAGWIFADYRNKFDGSDKNIVIYGHNMKNGSMFATLKRVINKSWYNNQENRIITLITESGQSKYEVFSTYKTQAESYYITTSFNDSEFSEFIKKIKSRSVYNYKVDVKSEDTILTLSTCDNNNNYRIVLHAKKID